MTELRYPVKSLLTDLGFYFSRRQDLPLIPPRNLTLTITRRCNQKCIMCKIRNNNIDKSHELSVMEVMNIIDQMKKMNIPELVLTGGEPLLTDNFFEMCDYASSNNLRVVIITNGFYPESFVKRLIASKVHHIQISLDGKCAATHDLIRKVKGSFSLTVNNIGMLVNAGKSVGATATIMSYNFSELLDIAFLAEKLGVTRLAIRPVHLDNSDPRNIKTNNKIWIPRDKLAEFDLVIDRLKEFNNDSFIDFGPDLEWLKAYFRNGYIMPTGLCYVGYNRLIITYNEKGDYGVWMCGGECGDIRRRNIRDIWYSKEAGNLRKKIRECKRACLFPEVYEPRLQDLESIASSYFINCQRRY